MYFDPSFILPKVIGLLILGIWLYTSFRQLRMYKYSEVVIGNLIDVIDNPEASSTLNKIAKIEFSYQGETTTITHFFRGYRDNYPKQVNVYINKRNIKKSIVKPPSKFAIVLDFLVPIIFSTLILISFFRVKGC